MVEVTRHTCAFMQMDIVLDLECVSAYDATTQNHSTTSVYRNVPTHPHVSQLVLNSFKTGQLPLDQRNTE